MMPFFKAVEIVKDWAIGTARASAQGQVITNVAIAINNDSWAPILAKKYQYAKAEPATICTIGV